MLDLSPLDDRQGLLEHGLESLSLEANDSLARGYHERAKRLLYAKMALRLLLAKKNDDDLMVGSIDESDLIELLNFLVEKLLFMRFFLHESCADCIMRSAYIAKVSPLTSLYRVLVRDSLFSMEAVDFDVLSCLDSLNAPDQSRPELHDHANFADVLALVTTIVTKKREIDPRRLAREALLIGQMLVLATKKMLDTTGEGDLCVQSMLYRLLIAHDCQSPDLFFGEARALRLGISDVLNREN